MIPVRRAFHLASIVATLGVLTACPPRDRQPTISPQATQAPDEVRACVGVTPDGPTANAHYVAAVEHDEGCAILISFDTQDDIDAFDAYRREHGLDPDRESVQLDSGESRAAPILKEVAN